MYFQDIIACQKTFLVIQSSRFPEFPDCCSGNFGYEYTAIGRSALSPQIRVASSEDLETLLRMDGSCTSEHVYQITQREDSDQIMITLIDVRLPRPMEVKYPRSARDILEALKKTDALLVAEEGKRSCGYVDLQIEPWQGIVWVKNLIVAARFRRQGVGSALLAAAEHWSRTRGMQALMIEAQSQNWPAIRFYKKNGFSFCGFNDRYYVDQIALFFTRPVN